MTNRIVVSLSKIDNVKFFDKVTLPFTYNNRTLIQVLPIGILTGTNMDMIKKALGYIEFVGKPVESLAQPDPTKGKELRKCFTFFSHLQEQWRKFTMNLESLTILARDLNRNNLDHSIVDNFLFFMHTPNYLPSINENEFINIKMGSMNSVQYSRVETRLLGSGFDTNCFDYDLDHKFANYNMRSDYIASCLRKSSICVRDNFFKNNNLLRKQYFSSNHQNILAKVCNERHNIFVKKNSEMKCQAKCRKDCRFTYFLHTYENHEQTRSKAGWIVISHNSLPDILITHLLEITFNAFVYNFGGLLGLWLGLSVFAIFSEFRDICIKLFDKRQQIISFHKNIFNNNKIQIYGRKLFKRIK